MNIAEAKAKLSELVARAEAGRRSSLLAMVSDG
jgi:antitoxin (DNA-binding transcriptional repressor) of toxin-antitoxin stability system